MTVFSKTVKSKILQGKSNKIVIKEWFLRWDKTIAITTTIITFFTLLVLVSFSLKSNQSVKEPDDEIRSFTNHLNYPLIHHNLNVEENGCFPRNSALICDSVNMAQLCDEINEWTNLKVDELQLINIYYSQYKINNGWLNCANLSFKKLKISGNTLKYLDDGAFGGNPFNTLTTLTLEKTGIETYSRKSFAEATVETLEIYDGISITLEENVFAEISGSLNILQMRGIIETSENLIKATGSKANTLGKIIEIDLRNNILGFLTNQSFTNVPRVTKLFLSYSKIFAIEAGTFNGLSLEILDLSNNDLTTIPEHIFDYVISGIYILGNRWECNCSLLWFRNSYNNSRELGENLFKDDFLCNNKTVYWKVDFCHNQTTTVLPTSTTKSTTFKTTESPVSTTQTTVLTTTTNDNSPTNSPTQPSDDTTITFSTTQPSDNPTTQSTTSKESVTTTESTVTDQPSTQVPPTISPNPKPKLINITCFDNSTSDILPQNLQQFQAFLRQGDVNISVHFDGRDHIVETSGVNNDDLLIWFNVDDNSTPRCSYNLRASGKVKIGPLQSNHTYTMCLLPNKSQTVSAFDCMGYTTPLEWKDQTWIPNQSMHVVIGIICGTLLAGVLISGLIVFYCIRQHPSLIKGNKRVIIVESQAADAIVMPKYYDQINYIPPSFTSSSQGYLTPINQIRSRSVVRTISRNTSMMSVPSPRVRKYWGRNRVTVQQVSQNFDDHVYEQPPPLPPNHPSEWIYNSSMNSYSRV